MTYIDLQTDILNNLYDYDLAVRKYQDILAIVDILPELPEPGDPYEVDEPRDLWLYRFNEPNVLLVEGVSFETASEYASRDDTHAEPDTNGLRPWFVGFDHS